MDITEYDRRWDLIMDSFRAGTFSAAEASAAVRELTTTRTR